MEICQTSNCLNSPIVICLHCQQQLCIEHLLQHNEELIHQANIYCDEFNELTEQIENMSFDEQFVSAEEEIHDWMNDQMKQLEKVYQGKLSQLKQTQFEVNEKLKHFQQIQQMKLNGIQRRLFNSQLNKQINLEQLNRMKTAVEQLRDDIDQFKISQTLITWVNNDQLDYSHKPNSQIPFQTINPNEIQQDCTNKSRLSPNAKPFECTSQHQNFDSLSSIRHDEFPSRLFDECALLGSINKTI